MDITSVLTLVLGAGGTGFVSMLYQFAQNKRKGKLESEDTLIARMNAQSAKDTARAEAAETRADKADSDSEKWREKLFTVQEESAYYRAYMVSKGVRVPRWPPDEGDEDA
jgi:hypothetical protein